MGSDEVLRGVAKTALGVAAVRAGESRRSDRLFDDPYAQRFLDAAPGAFPEEPAGGGAFAALGPMAELGMAFAHHGVLRTRFFDDYLLAAAEAGCRQVVLLAAGLDTRALRLAWPAGTRVFEVDLPEVFAFKEPLLAGCVEPSGCERVVVPADLREPWTDALVAAGFDRAAPTAWLAEGLLVYLTPEAAEGLVAGVSALSAAGGRLAFEYGHIADSALLAQAWRLPSMDPYRALWKGGLGTEAPARLRAHGWQARLHDRVDVAASYGRLVPGSSGRPVSGPSGGGFLTAVRAGPAPGPAPRSAHGGRNPLAEAETDRPTAKPTGRSRAVPGTVCCHPGA